MKVFDLKAMASALYEERNKNVFYEAKEFKARIIELQAGGKIPNCEMASYVIFYVLSGSAEVSVNQKKTPIKEGQCLISDPSTISMMSDKGAKILGIQVVKN